jgi:hypothetical protein
MKVVLFFLLCMSVPCFAAQAGADKSSNNLESYNPTELPATKISGVELLKPEYYAEIYQSFLDPIYRSDFYCVIDRIEINTSSPEAAQTFVDIYLKTGEHIGLHGMDAFYQSTATNPYSRAVTRVLQQLEGTLKTDPKLKEFFREHFPKHRQD